MGLLEAVQAIEKGRGIGATGHAQHNKAVVSGETHPAQGSGDLPI